MYIGWITPSKRKANVQPDGECLEVVTMGHIYRNFYKKRNLVPRIYHKICYRGSKDSSCREFDVVGFIRRDPKFNNNPDFNTLKFINKKDINNIRLIAECKDLMTPVSRNLVKKFIGSLEYLQIELKVKKGIIKGYFFVNENGFRPNALELLKINNIEPMTIKTKYLRVGG